jgi:hypothetical protein
MVAALEKLTNPLLRLPARRADSVRRTSSMQMLPDPSWDAGIIVRAVAQDRAVDGDATVRPLESNRMDVSIDDRSKIVSLDATLPRWIVDDLVGRPAISGFRAVVAGLAANGFDLTSPMAALLDDLPTVRLISGYARLMKEPPIQGMGGGHPILNICRGWAEGDTAHQNSIAGRSVVNTTTAAPPFEEMLDDPQDFLDEPASRPDSMRRRRILEIAPDGDGFTIFEYFRDSYTDDNGAESSLHEYIVRAHSDAEFVLTDIAVEPRALPFPECPLASPNAGELRGTSLREVHGSVRQLLAGTKGCTHLSDTLRFMRFSEPLTLGLRIPPTE